MTEKWTTERAIADPEGFGDWLETVDEDDPEFQQIELDEAWEADLAKLPADVAAYWRAWMRDRLERCVVELPDGSFAVIAPWDDDLDEGDVPDPGDGEDLPLLRHLANTEVRGPPIDVEPPAPRGSGRLITTAVQNNSNNGAPSIDPPGAAPQEHDRDPPPGHPAEPPQGRPVDRWWSFTERAFDARGHATTRDIHLDVLQIRAISAIPSPERPWLLESILKVAGIRQPIHVTEYPASIVQRLEMLASGEVRLRDG